MKRTGECDDAYDCQRIRYDRKLDDINDAMERRKRSIAASNGELYFNCSGQLSCRYFICMSFRARM